MIPYARQVISEADIEAVARVLRSDYLTQGPVVPRLEAEAARFCGSRYAVAVNSGTSALHLAYLALGVGQGDRVWTSPITFAATANAALHCGATVEFVDIDSRTFNLSVECLEQKLIVAEREGTVPKLVVPVHLCGQSCDMAAIGRLAMRFGFRVVEDASHAFGAELDGSRVGAGRFSDATVFSFHPVKVITSGEGGMVATNSAEIARRVALLRSHGITRDPKEMERSSEEPWYYEQVALGFNYRMTDIHAALGLSQLSAVDGFLKRRRFLAQRYDLELVELPVTLQEPLPGSLSAHHLYVVRVPSDAARDRNEIAEHMRASGVAVNLHYIPVYRHPFYAARMKVKPDCPQAERYYEDAISLPMYAGLGEDQQSVTIAAIAEACRPK
jgi:UDP-4-amino-4,6-dideoxy-N-acetyl-beta-L-altrosamine transaminase